MNLRQINEMRADMGLKPLQADPRKREAKIRNERNRSQRAQESRDLKAARGSNRKGK